MSKYTTEVRFICEQLSGLSESKGYNDVAEIIANARPEIFDFDYPIFDDEYKEVLETKILKHYYTREIGMETYGLWKLKLDMKMNEIMPYYNQLYESQLLKFNPFHDVDKTVVHVGDSDGSSHDSRSDREDTSGNSWNLFSDTPQGAVDGIAHAYDDIADNAYLTDARHITSSGNTNSAGQSSNVHSDRNKWADIIQGKQGVASYSKMLKEFRDTFLNIDLMIINDLRDLFFQLW